jgi:hypothetical protein
MKSILSILTLLLAFNITVAQTTAIPDANFEQALINMGYDNTIDGQVLTANINTVTYLSVQGLMISDLTGIQDFTDLINLWCPYNQLTTLDVTQNAVLTHLTCSSNQLTNLDVTQNTVLTYLICSSNQLTNLDVTQNTVLTYLTCSSNQLTNLDVTQNNALIEMWCSFNQLTNIDVTENIALTLLDCGFNQITNLDVTQNTALSELYCNDNNQLTCLNVKNDNNGELNSIQIINNPNLICVEVDDVAYSTTNWTGNNFYIDPQISFNTNCNNDCTVGIDEYSFTNLSLYPNPTDGNITIDLGEVKRGVKTTLTNSLGQIILSEDYNSTNFINIDALKGIYFLQIESDGEVITKKIIKE